MSYWYRQPDDSLLDDSGLTRAEKRAALLKIQDGRCAICAGDSDLVCDHDHETGLLRGLLCRSCNVQEGKARSLLFGGGGAGFREYWASPPAGGMGWMWDLPDPPGISIEEAIRQLQEVRLPHSKA